MINRLRNNFLIIANGLALFLIFFITLINASIEPSGGSVSVSESIPIISSFLNFIFSLIFIFLLFGSWIGILPIIFPYISILIVIAVFLAVALVIKKVDSEGFDRVRVFTYSSLIYGIFSFLIFQVLDYLLGIMEPRYFYAPTGAVLFVDLSVILIISLLNTSYWNVYYTSISLQIKEHLSSLKNTKFYSLIFISLILVVYLSLFHNPNIITVEGDEINADFQNMAKDYSGFQVKDDSLIFDSNANKKAFYQSKEIQLDCYRKLRYLYYNSSENNLFNFKIRHAMSMHEGWDEANIIETPTNLKGRQHYYINYKTNIKPYYPWEHYPTADEISFSVRTNKSNVSGRLSDFKIKLSDNCEYSKNKGSKGIKHKFLENSILKSILRRSDYLWRKLY